MIIKNIYIVAYDELYTILNEIKNNLKFKLHNHLTIEDFLDLIVKKKIDIKNSIVVFDINNKDFFKSIYKIKINYFNIKHLPIKIDELIEQLNVQFIKISYDNQSKINIKNYTVNLNSRIITSKNIDLKLTEKEIDIILFLNNNKIPKNIDTLQNKVWGYSAKLETHTVETHVYRLRKKIKDRFKDDNFIISYKNGYSIS